MALCWHPRVRRPGRDGFTRRRRRRTPTLPTSSALSTIQTTRPLTRSPRRRRSWPRGPPRRSRAWTGRATGRADSARSTHPRSPRTRRPGATRSGRASTCMLACARPPDAATAWNACVATRCARPWPLSDSTERQPARWPSSSESPGPTAPRTSRPGQRLSRTPGRAGPAPTGEPRAVPGVLAPRASWRPVIVPLSTLRRRSDANCPGRDR